MIAPLPSAKVVLDRPGRPYHVRWTRRAEARNASLPRPVEFSDIGKRKRSLFALCAVLWSALVEKDHVFESPEDLAEYLATEEQQLAAIRAISEMISEAYPEKKSPLKNEPSPDGPSTSSTSASEPATSIPTT